MQPEKPVRPVTWDASGGWACGTALGILIIAIAACNIASVVWGCK